MFRALPERLILSSFRKETVNGDGTAAVGLHRIGWVGPRSQLTGKPVSIISMASSSGRTPIARLQDSNDREQNGSMLYTNKAAQQQLPAPNSKRQKTL